MTAPPAFAGIYGTTATMFGSECMYKGTAAPLVHYAVAKGAGALDDFVSEFGLGGGDRVIRAQRIC